MYTIIGLSIFWILYGIAGLFGWQVIPEKHKGKAWTKSYIRCRGIAWLMTGIPWLLLCLATSSSNLDLITMSLLLLACTLPALIYARINDKKFNAMLPDK